MISMLDHTKQLSHDEHAMRPTPPTPPKRGVLARAIIATSPGQYKNQLGHHSYRGVDDQMAAACAPGTPRNGQARPATSPPYAPATGNSAVRWIANHRIQVTG